MLLPRRTDSSTVSVSRRAAIQVGCSGMLGLGLPQVLGGQARAAASGEARGSSMQRPKSVLVIFLTGAASHHDTFDMKPDAPAGNVMQGLFS